MNGLPGVGTHFADIDPPTVANDNWPFAPDWMTPAEALQWVRQRRKRLCRELATDPSLWACPEHRLTRTITLEMEKFALWIYYRVQ